MLDRRRNPTMARPGEIAGRHITAAALDQGRETACYCRFNAVPWFGQFP